MDWPYVYRLIFEDLRGAIMGKYEVDKSVDVQSEMEMTGKIIFDCCMEVGADIAEVGLDQLIDDGVLKELPVLSTILKTVKIGNSVHDWFYTRKLLTFIKAIYDGTVTEKEWNKHMEKLQKDPKRRIKELETLAVNIDRHNKRVKEIILANYYVEYIIGNISWAQFNLFAEALDIISFYDFDTLSFMVSNEYLSLEDEMENMLSLKHLNNAGLIDYYNGMEVVGINDEDKKFIAHITEFGRDFYKLGKISSISTEME